MAISDYILTSAVSGSRKKIIYVDDVQYSHFTLKKQLGEHYEIYTVESAVKMFDLITKVEPDLIILDINMPDMDGYETIIKLKGSDTYSKIPVVFISSRDDKESVLKGLSLGAADYFIKPFDTVKLIESIEKNTAHENNKAPAETEDTGKTESDVKTKISNEVRPNILIVDDSTSTLRTIHFSLDNKYNVTLLSKSEVVIEYLQNNDTDLILLDLLMPVINGFELIPKIKALPKVAIVPIIIISTEGKQEVINNAMRLGANDYIVKPFTASELNEKVEKYIRIMI